MSVIINRDNVLETVTLQPGDTIKCNPDGTLTVVEDPMRQFHKAIADTPILALLKAGLRVNHYALANDHHAGGTYVAFKDINNGFWFPLPFNNAITAKMINDAYPVSYKSGDNDGKFWFA